MQDSQTSKRVPTGPARIRRAEATDVEPAVPLIYSSGRDALDYVLGGADEGGAEAFLRMAFTDAEGEFGHRIHTVAELDGRVVGIGAAYSGGTSLRHAMAAGRQILRWCGVRCAGVMVRGLRAERVIAPPRRDVLYIGHLGVAPDMRGRGIGTQLIEHFLDEGRATRCSEAELDVSVENTEAQKLYERLGFRVTGERESSLRNAFGHVATHRRMVRDLEPTGI